MKQGLRKCGRVLLDIVQVIVMTAVFAGVGFFCLFAVNLILPSFINEVGENTTLKYSLIGLVLVLAATAGFIAWMTARRNRLKKVSFWLIGGYAGFLLGVIGPMVYMISRAASDYILPQNPYWG